MGDRKTEQLTVRISSDLAEKVRGKSARTGIPYSFAIRQFLQQWTEEKEDLLEEALKLIALRTSGTDALDQETLSEIIGYVQSLKNDGQH